MHPLPQTLAPVRAPAERPALLYLARFGPPPPCPETPARRVQAAALETCARLLVPSGAPAEHWPWHLLRYAHVMDLRSRLTAMDYAPATVNRHLSAIRGVLREAWLLGQLDALDYERAVSVQNVRFSRLPAGREVGEAELARLLAACPPATLAGARDAAVLALLYGAALRREEAAGLDVTAWDGEAGVLRVVGKGDKERAVPVRAGARVALEHWLKVRPPGPGPLLYPVNKAGRVEARRLSPQGLADILDRLARAAQVDHFSPHDLRRSYATHTLRKGGDLGLVQDNLGHSDPRTTRRYDRRGEEERAAVAELVSFPFTPG